MVLIRLVDRRNYFLTLLGLLSFLAYAAFAIALNLTLSHLREIQPAGSLAPAAYGILQVRICVAA
jgi:hypothetical protein